RKTDLITYLDIKAPNITNFFGYGDESIYDKTQSEKYKHYRARYSTGDLAILLRKRFSEKVMFTFGPAYQYYSLDSTDNVGRDILNTGLPAVPKFIIMLSSDGEWQLSELIFSQHTLVCLHFMIQENFGKMVLVPAHNGSMAMVGEYG